MKISRVNYPIILAGLLCSLFILSCNKSSKSETETTIGNYKTPETISLKFTDPEPFEWETITSDTLTTPVTYSLNVDALPSKKFELNTFKPLKTPMKEYDLDWDNLPTEKLKLDSVPFTITQTTIKKPTITKMKPPGNMDGTYANLMQLSTNEGLISNDISCFLETEDGAIWIASASSSLTRYDGGNAFTYDYPNVYEMAVDKQGKIWLMRPGSRIIVVLDFINDIEYTISPTPTSGIFNGIDIICDHKGSIYMLSINDGFYVMDPEIKSLHKIANEGSGSPWKLLEDNNDQLWFGFGPNLAVVNKERKELKILSETPNYELSYASYDIKEDQSGNIWLSAPYPNTTKNPTASPSILRLSLKEQKISVLSAENGYNFVGNEIVDDDLGNIWVFGREEAFVFSKNLDAFKIIGLNSKLRAPRRVTRPLKRKDGSIWIATTDKGVVITNDFTLKTEYFDDTRGLYNNEVWQIEENSRGEIWLGTRGGINIIDLQNNTIKALDPEKLHSRPNNTISFIKEISKDIYFIDSANGFSIFDRQKNKITLYANNANSPFDIARVAVVNDHTFLLYTQDGLFLYEIKDNTLKKVVSKSDAEILKRGGYPIMAYDNEILWVPSNNGLAKVNLKTNNISYLREEQGLCDNNGTVATFSKEGELWVATLNGISILNLEENTLTNLKEENGLIPAELFDLVEKENKIYAASLNGLIPIEKSTAKTANKGYYNFNGGLGFKSNDYLQGSPKFLKNGQFWTGVSNPSNEFRLLVMNAAPKPDTIVLSPHITSMFVMDENPGFDKKSSIDSLKNKVSSYAIINKMKWDSITSYYSLPYGLVLPYNQNSLSFSYASRDLLNREHLTYRFILEGEDKDWNYAGSTTKTKNYYNLKPGAYTFKVAARSNNQQWSVPTQLEFSIDPPWWQTWWAYVIFGLLAASILRAYIVFRARKLKRENRILEERVTLRTEQLKNKIDQLKATQSQLIQSEKMASLGELTAGIAHEIQNPLNFVNNFSEINVELIDEMQAEIKKGDYEEALALSEDVKDNQQKINHHGKRADGIVKGMLQHSRGSSSIKEPTDINKLADEYLRLAYHGLRAKDKSFNASLETDFDESLGLVNVIPQDMGRVILNLITNAFYASNERKMASKDSDFKPTVTVSTKKENNQILISVKDNGNGIPKNIVDKIFQPFFTTKPSGEGTGLGLSMSYDIVTKGHGGTLKIETKEGDGTTFIITIPNK